MIKIAHGTDCKQGWHISFCILIWHGRSIFLLNESTLQRVLLRIVISYRTPELSPAFNLSRGACTFIDPMRKLSYQHQTLLYKLAVSYSPSEFAPSGAIAYRESRYNPRIDPILYTCPPCCPD